MSAPVVPYPYSPSSGTFQTAYLGTPGSMQKLLVPDLQVGTSLGRGGVLHGLAGGGSTITHRRYTRRIYPITWSHRGHDEADILTQFVTGIQGVGPFALVIPGWRNMLDTEVSTMSTVADVVTGWSVPSGTLAISANTPAICGNTMVWTTPPNNGILYEGTQPGGVYTPSTTARPFATPYLTDQIAIVSIYAQSSSGTPNAAVAAIGVPVAGSATPQIVLGATTALNSASWTRLSVAVAIGQAGWSAAATPLINIGLKCLSAGGISLRVSNAQIQYGTAAVSAWVTGMGTPRVVIADPMSVTQSVGWSRRSASLMLVEV